MKQNETKLNGLLTPRQVKVLAALLTESSIESAARKTGISKVTIYRWLRDPIFASELRTLRERSVQQVMNALGESLCEAVALLRSQVADEALDPNIRQKAAAEVLRAGLKFLEVDLSARVEALERRIFSLGGEASWT